MLCSYIKLSDSKTIPCAEGEMILYARALMIPLYTHALSLISGTVRELIIHSGKMHNVTNRTNNGLLRKCILAKHRSKITCGTHKLMLTGMQCALEPVDIVNNQWTAEWEDTIDQKNVYINVAAFYCTDKRRAWQSMVSLRDDEMNSCFKQNLKEKRLMA